MNEREALAILISAQRIGYSQRQHALDEAGSALSLLADPHAYAHVLGGAGIAAIREAMRESGRLLEYLDRTGTKLIAIGDPGYPRLLRSIAHPPPLLFCMGRNDLGDPFPFAVVGTRRASAYGLRHTREISRELAKAGMTIVSGMAAGIDAAAHWGALDSQGRTIAVLGGALDKPYPAENKGLMQRIVESGGSVISEYPPGVAPTRYSFVHRNRIIAGMCLGVLVSDAPMKSGAQHTVRMALDEGREVFALPGDVDRPGSQLPNQLLRDGAHMAACAGDILSELVVEPDGTKPKKQTEKKNDIQTAEPALPSRRLDAKEQAVYDLLLEGDMDFDALSEKTGIPGDELGGLLMMLELDGIVEALPGLFYRLV